MDAVHSMCDEYDDERMRMFWRILAEREDLVRLAIVGTDTAATGVTPLGAEPASKPKPRPLLR